MRFRILTALVASLCLAADATAQDRNDKNVNRDKPTTGNSLNERASSPERNNRFSSEPERDATSRFRNDDRREELEDARERREENREEIEERLEERRERVEDRRDRLEDRLDDGRDDRRRAGNSSNQWRYKRHNNEWWYWHPSNYWVYWRDGTWHRYNRNSYRVLPRNRFDDRYNTEYSYRNTYRSPNFDYYDRQYYGPGGRFTDPRNAYSGRYYSGYGNRNYYDGYGNRYYDGRYSRGFNQPYNDGGRIGRGVGGAIGGRRGAAIGGAIGNAIDD